MPAVQILFYRDPGELPPVLEWLDGLPADQRVRSWDLIRTLAREGHELRRPHADTLRDGIYELRATLRGQQNRILYFFERQGLIILAHSLKKERAVSDQAIQLAKRRRERFRAEPEAYSAEVEL
jgi:phage-related protein